MIKYFSLIYVMFLSACSCDHNNCTIGETFFKRENKEEGESLKPWEKPHETVSGIKKEEVRLQHNFLTLENQTLSAKELILKQKRAEEKKSTPSRFPKE